LAPETTFYLVVLSCTKTCLMKRFYVDDNYDCKKEQNVRFKFIFFCFFLCVVENDVRKELDNGLRLQEVSKIPR
jgi:hypothetical protein